ncbi:MAG: hypothetical protein WD016_12235 [Balneolaceae bacterium]
MKTLKTLLTLFTLVAVFSTGAFAQEVEISANVVNAISVVTNNSVSFGDVDNNADATIQAGDDDAGNPDANAGTPVNGQVTISNVASSQTIVVSWNDGDVLLSDGDGTTIAFDPRIFSDLTGGELTTPGGSNIAFGGGDTSDILYVGGDLSSTGVPAGVYNTTLGGGNGITITVEYL